jgi:hypothetical protein
MKNGIKNNSTAEAGTESRCNITSMKLQKFILGVCILFRVRLGAFPYPYCRTCLAKWLPTG